MKTKQIIFTAPYTVGFKEYDLGELGDDMVLCKTKISGISHGTEMTNLSGDAPFVNRMITAERTFRDKAAGDPDFYPFHWAGYDAVGIVEYVGKNVTKYKSGDRVWCQMRHQTYFVFDESAYDAIKLPETVEDIEGATVNLSSVSLCGIVDAQIKLGDNVVIFGGGFVGIMAAQLAVLSGARCVVLVEPDAKRRKIVENYKNVTALPLNGDDTTKDIVAALGGVFPEVTMDCSGSTKGLCSAIKAAGVNGTVVGVGFCAGNDIIPFGEELLHNRITLIASMSKWGCANRFQNWDEGRLLRTIVELYARGDINTDGMETEYFDFNNAEKAYKTLANATDKPLKAIFTY